MSDLEIIVNKMIKYGQVIPDHIFIGPALWSNFIKDLESKMICSSYAISYSFKEVRYSFLSGYSTIHLVNEPGDFILMGDIDAYSNYSFEKAVWQS